MVRGKGLNLMGDNMGLILNIWVIWKPVRNFNIVCTRYSDPKGNTDAEGKEK